MRAAALPPPIIETRPALIRWRESAVAWLASITVVRATYCRLESITDMFCVVVKRWSIGLLCHQRPKPESLHYPSAFCGFFGRLHMGGRCGGKDHAFV